MVLIPASFVGYHVFQEDLERYRIHEHLPKNDRRLVYDIGSKIGVNLWLVRVEVEDESLPSVLYLCCFAVHDPAPWDANALSAVPIPPNFPRITEVIPVEEVNNNPKLYKLFEPYTTIVTPPSANRIVGACTMFASLTVTYISLSLA